MTSYITIYTPDGEVRKDYPVTRDSEISCTLMGDTFIKVVFNHPDIIDFKAGSFISHNQRKWSLLKNYKPEGLASVDGYKYELKFYAEQHQLQRCSLFWKQGNTREVSFNLTTRLQDYAQLICDNINYFLSTTSYNLYTTWSVGDIPANLSDKCVYQAFDGVSCWDALTAIANAFEVEWWVEDHWGARTAKLHFGKCENGNAIEFAEGGIVSKMPASKRGDDAKYGTRFYVYGGTQNIPDDYYASQDGGVTNHVSAKRLHLPSGYSYIDSKSGLQPNEVIEKVITCDDIFPINTETIDEVTTRTETTDGVETTYYKIKCVNSPFNPSTDKLATTLGAKFLTGSLMGREYDLIHDADFLTKKTFEIVARNEGTGDASIVTPNQYLKPKAGDTFVLTGVLLSKKRIEEAEFKLLEVGQVIAHQHSADTEVYGCPTNPVHCAQNNHNFQLGQRVTLVGAAFGDGRISRIQGYTKKLWNEYEATYSVGDNARYTRYGAISVIATNLKVETTKQFQSLQKSTGRVNTELKIVANSTGNISNIERKVGILIGGDVDKSARTIATEVLAGASTGGGIDLDLYLSKSEAEATYATKESLETTNDSIDSIATRLGKAETNIGNNSNLLSAHSQRLQTLQTEQESQKATIQQQGTAILALDAEVDGVKGDVSDAKDAIDAIEAGLKDKASQEAVDDISESVEALVSQINTKVGKDDLKPLTYTVNGVSQTFNGLSEATIPQIFTPTQTGSQGQVLQSMGGGAPQWANLSDVKGAVGFAKDLTGVLEATPEEFTFRPSAGDKSIRDESAVIRRIKGNTTVWNQHLQNNGISAGDKYVDIVQDDTEWTGNLQNMDSSCDNPWKFGIKVPTLRKTVGHKYLLVMDAMVSRITSSYYNDIFALAWGNELFDVNVQMNEPSKWQSLSCVFSPNIASEDTYSIIRAPWCFTYSLGGKNGDYYKVKNAQLFDLTNLFGDGNEPTTLEEFKRSYPDDYYPYCEPEIRNMRAWGIETVSANAFDKDSTVAGVVNADGTIVDNANYSLAKIEVVPNERYSLHNVANTYYDGIRFSYALYDSDDRLLSVGGIKDVTTTNRTATGDVDIPNGARYISVVVHNDYLDSCCVNLRHSGTFNASDATYFKKVRELTEIANYFPDGMNSVGEVYDEINAENAIQRCGVRAYEDGDENNPNVMTDRTNTVYQLAEPIVTPITEPLQLDYEVADFGTEKAFTAPKSSPFKADIVYQFNAEGRIRDNGRNIERIEVQMKNLATREYVIEVMPTEIATATQKMTISAAPVRNAYMANVVYEWLGTPVSLDIQSLTASDASYENVWTIRFGCTTATSLVITPSVLWKDGVAPRFEAWGVCELRFTKQDDLLGGNYLGEWKIYK